MVTTTNPLLQPCTQLNKIGPKLAEKFAKCGMVQIIDLLFYLPFRYQDRTRLSAIAALNIGDYAVVEGTITNSRYQQGKRSSFTCQLSDGTGTLTLRFFHVSPQQAQGLTHGSRLRCFGEVRYFTGFEMAHPEYAFLNDNQSLPIEERLTPIYHSTAGLSQHMIRLAVKQALALIADEHDEQRYLNEYLPADIRQQYDWGTLAQAIRFIHHPPNDVDVTVLEEMEHPQQQRLIFEELLAQQLSMAKLRQHMQKQHAKVYQHDEQLMQTLTRQLPFPLTSAQQRVIHEIKADLSQARPMLRLLQGDVGAGKTVVAALLASIVVEAGDQVALMAPTEILAEQHAQSLRAWFEPLGVQVAYLSGKSKTRERRESLAAFADGSAHIAVGTHALFQTDVVFHSLGFIIIDEQHRFGVHQRMALRDKGQQGALCPHQLIMTATPIPRTLAMTAYADLDVSIIDELPPGRTPVTTVAIANHRRTEVIDRIRHATQQQRQVYWVCTLIEESEMLQCQAAEATAELLTNELPDINVGLVHGRLKPSDKEAVMQQFKQGGIDLLVATTVIEVGVDVPNASLMIIENPERLGLSQLHQLRGRVGRGAQQSYCVLLYQSPLSQHGRERLHIMRSTTDGFEIARQDLQLRGPGDVLGTRQTGMINLRIADVLRDEAMIPQAQQVAQQLIQQDSKAVKELMQRWFANSLNYGGV